MYPYPATKLKILEFWENCLKGKCYEIVDQFFVGQNKMQGLHVNRLKQFCSFFRLSNKIWNIQIRIVVGNREPPNFHILK